MKDYVHTSMWDTSGGMNRGAIDAQHKGQVTFPFALFVNIILYSQKLEKGPIKMLNHTVYLMIVCWSSVGRGLGYQISEKPNNYGTHKWKKTPKLSTWIDHNIATFQAIPLFKRQDHILLIPPDDGRSWPHVPTPSPTNHAKTSSTETVVCTWSSWILKLEVELFNKVGQV